MAPPTGNGHSVAVRPIKRLAASEPRSTCGQLRVCVTVDHDLVRVAVRGAVDLASAATLERALVSVAATGHGVLVDLAETSFLSCRGIGALVAAREQLERRGAWLRVVNARGIVLRAVTLSDLGDLLVAGDAAVT